MPKIWKKFSSKRFSRYELSKLIDHHRRSEFPSGDGAFQIVCDIDKTYLETKFESFVDIVQVALETATSKQTVEGAADILMAARWGDIYGPITAKLNGLHFISSSPPQLRPVLEEKLMIDGLEWDSDTFKNQAYNLLKGKMSYLKQHIAYKSSAILRVVSSCPKDSSLIFIGDNAESDPIIYLGVCLYLANVFDEGTYLEYLRTAGADAISLETFSEVLDKPFATNVAGVIIRNAPGYSRAIPQLFSQYIRSFDHFYEVSFHLHNIGVIADEVLIKLTKDFHNYYGIDKSYLCSVIEAASIDRDQDYLTLMDQCLEILKITPDSHWKRDVSRDLSPLNFSAINQIKPEDAIAFAKEWRVK